MVKVKRKIRKNSYTDPKTGKFSPGNPGKPKGAKSRMTLLKEKLLKEALELDFGATKTVRIYNKQGKVYKEFEIRAIPEKDILKIASTLIPKETKMDLNTNQPLAIEVVHNYKPKGTGSVEK